MLKRGFLAPPRQNWGGGGGGPTDRWGVRGGVPEIEGADYESTKRLHAGFSDGSLALPVRCDF